MFTEDGLERLGFFATIYLGCFIVGGLIIWIIDAYQVREWLIAFFG